MTDVPLAEAVDASLFGGKAAQLAVALGAGLPVPPGVALSVPLVEAVARGNPWAGRMLDQALRPLRPPLAVRSSAVGEDSEQASFAGQHLTRLNLRTTTQVRDAVAAIQRSAHTPGALAYRRRLDLPRQPSIAVLVQEFVDADCAGVLFTRNPLDGADELVIEASWGLGEAVVAGLVVPERLRVSRDGRVLERSVGRKDVVVRPMPEGGTKEHRAPTELAHRQCLADAHVRKLLTLAHCCDRVFPGAHDLEWAFARTDLFLLQHRAVTRVTTPAARAAHIERGGHP
jgi:pyruvate,water dikinase